MTGAGDIKTVEQFTGFKGLDLAKNFVFSGSLLVFQQGDMTWQQFSQKAKSCARQ